MTPKALFIRVIVGVVLVGVKGVEDVLEVSETAGVAVEEVGVVVEVGVKVVIVEVVGGDVVGVWVDEKGGIAKGMSSMASKKMGSSSQNTSSRSDSCT
jgi:hypothetical protein